MAIQMLRKVITLLYCFWLKKKKNYHSRIQSPRGWEAQQKIFHRAIQLHTETLAQKARHRVGFGSSSGSTHCPRSGGRVLGELLGRRWQRNLLSEALGPLPYYSPACPRVPRGLESQLGLPAGAPKCLVPPVGRKKGQVTWRRSLCPTFLLPGCFSNPRPSPGG